MALEHPSETAMRTPGQRTTPLESLQRGFLEDACLVQLTGLGVLSVRSVLHSDAGIAHEQVQEAGVHLQAIMASLGPTSLGRLSVTFAFVLVHGVAVMVEACESRGVQIGPLAPADIVVCESRLILLPQRLLPMCPGLLFKAGVHRRAGREAIRRNARVDCSMSQETRRDLVELLPYLVTGQASAPMRLALRSVPMLPDCVDAMVALHETAPIGARRIRETVANILVRHVKAMPDARQVYSETLRHCSHLIPGPAGPREAPRKAVA